MCTLIITFAVGVIVGWILSALATVLIDQKKHEIR